MFTIKQGAIEEDMIEGAYSSTQPLIACGFVNDEVIWTQTSINTIEILRISDATCFMNIAKFPHDVSFLIRCEVIGGILCIYAGNLNGEVYIYTIENF